ncbi:MAG: hypothetical protein AAB634_02190, partial [Patescibacteria group bacterium]
MPFWLFYQSDFLTKPLISIKSRYASFTSSNEVRTNVAITSSASTPLTSIGGFGEMLQAGYA